MDDPMREAIAKCIVRGVTVLERRMADRPDKELLVKGGRNLLRVIGARLLYEEALRWVWFWLWVSSIKVYLSVGAGPVAPHLPSIVRCRLTRPPSLDPRPDRPKFEELDGLRAEEKERVGKVKASEEAFFKSIKNRKFDDLFEAREVSVHACGTWAPCLLLLLRALCRGTHVRRTHVRGTGGVKRPSTQKAVKTDAEVVEEHKEVERMKEVGQPVGGTALFCLLPVSPTPIGLTPD